MAARRLSRLVAAVCSATLALAACTGGSGTAPSPTASGSSYPDPVWLHSPHADAYGYGAIRVPGVTLQPAVVLVEGGPDAIRGASSDGLVWTIDRAAPGAALLREGSVMVMTSRATGRVAEVHDEGATRVVTLLPVALSDIIRDGTITLDQAVDPGTMLRQSVPDLVGAVAEIDAVDAPPSGSPTPAAGSSATGALFAQTDPTAPPPPRKPLPPPTKAGQTELSVGAGASPRSPTRPSSASASATPVG